MNKLKVGLFFLMMSLGFISLAQEEVPFIEKGNEAYKTGNYENASVAYEEALAKKYDSHEGIFNLGNALYQQKKYDEASEKFKLLTQQDIPEKSKKAKAFHNYGNCFMEKQDYQKAANQYKDALRLDPTNENTRYNLAYALDKLKNQEGGEGQDNKDQQDQNEDQNQDQKNKDQQNQDGDDQKKDDQQQKEQQGQDKKKDQKQQDQQQQKGNKKNEMSKEEAEQMLQALMQNEQQLQDKNAKKEKGQPIRIEKEW